MIGSRSKVTVNKCVSRTDTNPPFAFDISPFFCPPGGLLTPQRGEDTSGTRVRQHAKFGVNRPAGCREIVDKKADKKQRTCSKTVYISPFALTSEWRVINNRPIFVFHCNYGHTLYRYRDKARYWSKSRFLHIPSTHNNLPGKKRLQIFSRFFHNRARFLTNQILRIVLFSHISRVLQTENNLNSAAFK